MALNARHRAAALREAAEALNEAETTRDPIILAEALRHARTALDRITGKAGVEDMLDGLVRSILHRKVNVPRGTMR